MRTIAASLVLMIGCGDDGGPAAIDARDVDAAIDATQAPACADPALILDTGTVSRFTSIAIAADGTTYLSSTDTAGRIYRWSPGGSGVDNWVTLPGSRAIFRLAIDPATGMVYAGSVDGLWQIDPQTRSPLNYDLGQIRAVTIGPDGALYYTAHPGEQNVFRSTAPAQRTQVTTSGLGEPADLLFDADGTLLVDDLVPGRIVRISLDANHVETGRDQPLTSMNDRPNSIARDVTGRYYVSFSQQGLVRYDAGFVNPTVVNPDGDLSDQAFARGWLGCETLYLSPASGAPIATFIGEAGTP